jgi:hypothetical protein
LLWISWGHHERKYFMEKNPIVQSMLPKAAGPEKRKGASMVSMRSAVASQSSTNAGATLRAADYTPPSGFVETMERPSPYSAQRSSATTKSVTFNDKIDGNVLADLWKI